MQQAVYTTQIDEYTEIGHVLDYTFEHLTFFQVFEDFGFLLLEIFLDEYFNRQYVNDRRFSELIWVFSVLAIMLGCLGLFGLSAYMAKQKTKEIGIRKVLGSSVLGIFIMLSRQFVVLIVIAIVLAVPLTIWGMQQWLDSFAYRDGMSALTFVIAAGAVLFIALATISYHTIRAARANPVRSLRYE